MSLTTRMLIISEEGFNIIVALLPNPGKVMCNVHNDIAKLFWLIQEANPLASAAINKE